MAVVPDRTTWWLLCLMLVGVTLFTYRESLEHDFVTMDDYPYVVENVHLRDGLNRETVIWAIGSFQGSSWFPLTWLSLALDVELSGLDARSFHRTNVVLHAVNVLLLYLALSALTGSRWRSLLTAGVFALHPIHVESVAWITERKDVLSGLFFMLTLWAWARYAERATGLRYFAVASCFGFGLLAKSSLVTLPFLLLLLDFWPLRRVQGEMPDARVSRERVLRALFEKLPLFLFAVAAATTTYWAGVSGNALESNERLSLLHRLANAAIAYVGYLRDSLWPAGLSPFYPHPGEDVSLAGGAAAAVLLIGISVFALSKIRTQPQLAIGWLWFLGCMVPMIGLVQAGAQARADRFMYLPQIGLCIAVFWSIPSHVFSNRVVRLSLISLATIGLCLLSYTTQVQLGIWRNGITLFEHTQATTGSNAFVHHGLGQAYLRAGRLDEAAEEYRAALSFSPNWVRPMAALGEVMSDRQRPDKAAKWFERALILRPDWVEVRRRLAELLVEQDNPRAAIPHLKKLLETKAYADNAETHGVLGLAFARNRNAKAAAMHYREALALRPEFASVHANLGMLLSEQGSADRALFHLSEAIRLGSNEAEVHFARSNLLLARGSEREGLAALRRAVGARPNWLAPVNNLAWHLVSVSDEALRDPSEALGYARLAARLSSRANPSVLETLAAVLESDGRIEEAIAVLHEAIALARGGGDLVLAKRLTAHQNRLRSSPPLLHRND